MWKKDKLLMGKAKRESEGLFDREDRGRGKKIKKTMKKLGQKRKGGIRGS